MPAESACYYHSVVSCLLVNRAEIEGVLVNFISRVNFYGNEAREVHSSSIPLLRELLHRFIRNVRALFSLMDRCPCVSVSLDVRARLAPVLSDRRHCNQVGRLCIF